MARRRKSQLPILLKTILVLIGAALTIRLLSNEIVQLFLLAAVIIAGYFGVKWCVKHFREQKILAIDFREIDAMSGHAFERYIGELLRLRGYEATVTRGSGDNGVDMIATRDGNRWAIQCKRLASKVDRRAISDAVSATSSTKFSCNKAMVVTNSYFTSGAIEYGASTNCFLVDRKQLSKWILEVRSAQTSTKQIPETISELVPGDTAPSE